MHPHALLAACRAAGMTVTLDGDQLKVTRPTNAKTDKLLTQLKARKAEVLAWLTPCCGTRPPGVAGGPLKLSCQLCPNSPVYWRKA